MSNSVVRRFQAMEAGGNKDDTFPALPEFSVIRETSSSAVRVRYTPEHFWCNYLCHRALSFSEVSIIVKCLTKRNKNDSNIYGKSLAPVLMMMMIYSLAVILKVRMEFKKKSESLEEMKNTQ
nr:uncharacterized protein LOC111513160 [Leptinotarsa decemlineata]